MENNLFLEKIMKRNLWKFSFGLLGFFILFSIFSCNNIISPKKATQVSFNLDISGLQETHQNQANFLNSRVAEDSISHISVSLYQVTDSASVSENQELDTSKLPLLESITPSVAPDGKVLATFNEVTVGIDAVIFVEIYELTDANEKILAYKGNSPVFPVREGENNVKVDLEKVQNQEVKQEFTVTFDTNGGNFADGKATSLTVTSGETVTLTDYVPTKSGFNFGGWYFDEGLQKGADSRVIPNKDNTTSGTLTLYTKWEAVNNSITSFADLKSAITSASETIHVAGNFEISETLTISSATTIIADATTAFTRATGFTGALFTNSADFTLQGSENAIITIDGNDIEASAPAIQSTANLTLTYCDFVNNTNNYSEGGAIYVNTASEVTLTASNCNFTNNKVTGANKAGGAVAIDGNLSSSSFIDCKFESNMTSNLNGSDTYGGAIYLDGDITTNGKWYEFTNCIFTNNSCVASKNYGGAIYFSRGSLSLNNVTMTGNTWDTGTSNKSSDILAETTSSNLKLDGSIQINSLEIPPKDPPKNLALADTFDTTSIIQISIDSSQSSLFKVVTYDSIGSTNTTTTLTQDQIACFTSIVDSNGVQYTLNDNGTISTQ